MLDTFTLYSIIVTTVLVGSGLVWMYGRRSPDAVGVGAWAAGSGLAGLFFLCLVSRQWLPPFVSVSLANGFVAAGLACMHLSACKMTARRWPMAWHAAAVVFIVVTIALFCQDVQTGFRFRMLLTSPITAAQAVVTALAFLKANDDTGAEERRARRLAAGVFCVISTVQLSRGLAVLPASAVLDASLLSRNTMSYWSAAVFLAISLTLPFLIAYINEARTRHSLNRAIEALRIALAEVKTLEGLIPICSSCRRIREPDDRWLSIGHYLESHVDIQLEQGLCPDCRDRATVSGAGR